MKISIVMPEGTAARTGNQHTAQRWAGFLRKGRHRVSVAEKWDGAATDALIALHARKSAASVERFHRAHPDLPLIVALTGTDLYRDIETFPEARRSLDLATCLILLQPHGRTRLERRLRPKARVIFQSADTRLSHRPPRGTFRVIVVGNLREEKDPFRAVAALSRLPHDARIEVVQVGAALSPDMAAEAARWAKREPRYRWRKGMPHPEALRAIAQSHLLVVSSVMEGGANVICEAARIGVPVLASRISGNLGMLGPDYQGYFPLRDDARLGRLIARASTDRDFYRILKGAVVARRRLFAPGAERNALARLVAECAS
jgi:putative glycosyltransferase (TIGR04348 family)